MKLIKHSKLKCKYVKNGKEIQFFVVSVKKKKKRHCWVGRGAWLHPWILESKHAEN